MTKDVYYNQSAKRYSIKEKQKEALSEVPSAFLEH